MMDASTLARYGLENITKSLTWLKQKSSIRLMLQSILGKLYSDVGFLRFAQRTNTSADKYPLIARSLHHGDGALVTVPRPAESKRFSFGSMVSDTSIPDYDSGTYAK